MIESRSPMAQRKRTIIDEIILEFQDQDSYHRALGRFLHIFSDIEARMQEALRHLSGVTEPVAKAIFSGTRSQQAANYIGRTGEASGWPKSKRLEWNAISTKLDELAFLRNQIVHYGAAWQEVNAWLVTDKLVAIPGKETHILISPTILADAIADLEKLDCHVYAFVWPERYAKHKASLDNVLNHAWRYKLPSPIRRQQKTRGKG
jgi:hypothetical protein